MHAGTVDYSRFEMLAKDLPEDEEADISDNANEDIEMY
jgi:hypothetical protein